MDKVETTPVESGKPVWVPPRVEALAPAQGAEKINNPGEIILLPGDTFGPS